MRWSSATALALGLGLAAAGVVRAGELDDASAPAVAVAPTGDLRAYVVAQLDAQAEVLARTRATVDDKVAAAAADRARRVRAAYRLLRAGAAPAWSEADERMATARRRAAARWVLARDRHEQALLADEAAELAAADTRLTADRALAATIPLPTPDLARPVAGAIARHFGAFEHERSKATLTRRGVDFEVAEHAEVRPVADGVVTYAGPIRGLDDGLIVDHGGWLSVYGKLAPLTVARGDRVARGQVVGHAARRRVYLEIRVAVSPGGVPVDPERLMK